MKRIERNEAIRLINIISIREFGWDREELHNMLRKWGFGEEPRLSEMRGIELHNILKLMGRGYYFVEESKRIKYLRCEMRRCEITERQMRGIVNKVIGKRSEYQLTEGDFKRLIKIMRYYKIKEARDGKS